MSIARVNGAQAQATASYVDCSVPNGVQDDDLLVAFWFWNGSDALSPPSGWTDIAVKPASTTRCAVCYRVADSEPASYRFSLPSTGRVGAQIMAFRGVDVADPIEAVSNTLSSTDQHSTAASVDIETAGCCLIYAGYGDNDEGGGAWTAKPSGFTEDLSQTASTYYDMLFMTKLDVSTGSTDALAASKASSYSNDWKHAFLVAIKAADAPLSIPLLNHLLLGD